MFDRVCLHLVAYRAPARHEQEAKRIANGTACSEAAEACASPTCRWETWKIISAWQKVVPDPLQVFFWYPEMRFFHIDPGNLFLEGKISTFGSVYLIFLHRPSSPPLFCLVLLIGTILLDNSRKKLQNRLDNSRKTSHYKYKIKRKRRVSQVSL